MQNPKNESDRRAIRPYLGARLKLEHDGSRFPPDGRLHAYNRHESFAKAWMVL